MTIEITDLTQLAPADVSAAAAQATTQIAALFPALDLKRGPVQDLVITPHSIFAAAQAENLARYLSARSLLDIQNDPTLADPGVVDGILSNFLLTRGAAAYASGPVTITVSQNTTVTIASGAAFDANGYTYTTSRVFTAKGEVEQLNGPGDVLLTPLSNGTYAFNITVTATTAGTAPSLSNGTALIPEAPPTTFVAAYATADFTGGADAETNTALINRLLAGIATRAPSNRTNIQGMLRNDPVLGTYQALSIIGYGDPEMLRDKHSLFPVSAGGRADLYFRLNGPCSLLGLIVAPTLVSVSSGGGVWQFAIGRDVAPGFYEVRNIQPAGSGLTSGGYQILSDARSFDFTALGWIPDIQSFVEGGYSRYQTTVIQFLDPTTPLTATPGTVGSYQINIAYSPGIDILQDQYLSDRQTRSYGSDMLAKAPVPCFVRVRLNLYKAATDPAPDTTSITQAIASAVNAVGFTGRLFASTLLEAAAPYLVGGIASFDMIGTIRGPGGLKLFVRDPTVLTIPDRPADGITANTVQFFCDPTTILLTVTNAVPSAL